MTKSIRFDASGDGLAKTTGTIIDPELAYTMAGRFKLAANNSTSYQTIAIIYATGSAWDAVFLDASLVLKLDVNGTIVSSGQTLTAGTWYHIAVVRESATSLKLYLDGTLVATNTTSAAGRSAGSAMYFGYETFGTWVNGNFAGWNIWSAALTSTQVNTEKDYFVPQVTSGLFATLALQGNAFDSSTNGNDFSATGTVTYTEAGPTTTNPIQIAKLFTFDSTAEGLAEGGGAAAITFGFLSTDGSPANGSVNFTCATKGITQTETGVQPASTYTWESWGVPAGATVSSVSNAGLRHKVAAVTRLTSHDLAMVILNNSNTQIISDLIPGLTLPTTLQSVFTTYADTSSVNVLSGNTGSATNVRLNLSYTLTTSTGGGTADIQLRIDTIRLSITYTESSGSNQYTKSVAGALSPTGGMTKRVSRVLSGLLASAGSVAAIRTVLVYLTGALSPAGGLLRRAQKVLDGLLSPSGALTYVPPSGGGAAVQSKVGSFTISASDTVGTTQQITVGFQPKLILFWSMGQASATDAITNQTARYGFGAAASTTSRQCAGGTSTHAAAAIDGGRIARADACFATVLAAGTVDGLLDISAIDSTSFTVIVDDQFASSVRISYMAIGGDAITDVALGTFAASTTTGTQDVTGLAFQPDFLLTFGSASTTAAPFASSSRDFLSVGAAVSATNQAIISVGEGPEANATSQAGSYLYYGEVAAPLFDTPTETRNRAAFVQFLSNGFQLNWLEAAFAYQLMYVAVKGGNWLVGNLQTQTDTTTDIVESGFGFQPKGVMLLSHSMVQSTQDTVQGNARLSIGAFTSTTERVAHSLLLETGLADTDVTNAIEHDEIYINLATDGTVQGLMDVKSVDSGGFTLIMDDADPSQAFAWYFVVGSAASGGNQYTQALAGALSPVAALLRSMTTNRTGMVAPTGSAAKLVSTAKVAAVGPSGSLVRQVAKSVLGAVSISGAVQAVKSFLRALSGTMSPNGTIAKRTNRAVTGLLVPAATVLKSSRKNTSAAVASAGSLTKQAGRSLAGLVAASGVASAVKTFLRVLAGSLSPSGVIAKQASRTITGALSSAGSTTKQTRKTFAGLVNPSGTLSAIRTILIVLSGAVAAGGTLTRRTGKALLATLPSTGSLVGRANKVLAATVAGAGALTKRTSTNLSGVTTSAGAVAKRANRAVVGALASAGTLSKRIGKSFAGAVSPTGFFTTAQSFLVSLAGTLSPSGALARRTGKVLPAALAASGALTKRINRSLIALVTTTGSVAALKTFLRTLSGTVASAGSISRRTIKTIGGTVIFTGSLGFVSNYARVLVGALAPNGAISKRIGKGISGAIALSGSLSAIRSILVSLVGSVSSLGTLTKRTRTNLTGAALSVGTVSKNVSKRLAGALSAAGTLASYRVVMVVLSGALSATGAIVKRSTRALDGSVASDGALRKMASRTVQGSVSALATVSRQTKKALLGSLPSSGSLSMVKSFVRALVGSVSPSGTRSKRVYKSIVGAITPTATTTKVVYALTVLIGKVRLAGQWARTTLGGKFKNNSMLGRFNDHKDLDGEL